MAQLFIIAPTEDYFFSRKVAPDTLKAARIARLVAPERTWASDPGSPILRQAIGMTDDPREQVIIADRLARGGQQG